MFYVYLLHTSEGQTYVGATTDPNRRLRQHNKEISGGARATSIKVEQGLEWSLLCYITGIPEWRSALQIEWRWKQIGRTKFKNIKNPIERRLYSLKKLLSLDKPTEKAMSYNSYPDGLPDIVWLNKDFEDKYNSITLE